MTLPLQLEYVCTEAEMREAQSLNLRRQLGKGSRAQTLVTLFGIFAVVLTLGYFQIRAEVAPKYHPWVLAAVVGFIVFVYFRQFRSRRKPGRSTKLEVSDREVMVEGNGARVAMSWSGFSECLESSHLFVLLDKPKGMLVVLPKRVFPDEAAQNWFRNQASQHPPVAASAADMPIVSSRPVQADGIALNFQLGFRDYLTRTLASWRTKGIVILVYMVITGACLYQAAQPMPHAVNSPAKVYFVFMLPIFTLMLAVIVTAMAFMEWRAHRDYLSRRQIILSGDRIDLSDSSGNGHMPWTA